MREGQVGCSCNAWNYQFSFEGDANSTPWHSTHSPAAGKEVKSYEWRNVKSSKVTYSLIALSKLVLYSSHTHASSRASNSMVHILLYSSYSYLRSIDRFIEKQSKPITPPSQSIVKGHSGSPLLNVLAKCALKKKTTRFFDSWCMQCKRHTIVVRLTKEMIEKETRSAEPDSGECTGYRDGSYRGDVGCVEGIGCW